MTVQAIANATTSQPLRDILNTVFDEIAAIRKQLGAATGGTGAGILVGSVAWNPADLADGAGETSPNITVTGAAIGDFVLASVGIDLAGVTLTGYVSAADTVNVRAQNESGSAYNTKDFGTCKVIVIPQAAAAQALAAMVLTKT